MVATSLDAERTSDDERFVARTVHETPRMKVVLGYFEPGQLCPFTPPTATWP